MNTEGSIPSPEKNRFYEVTQENIQEQFDAAKRFLEEEYGIKLSQIELVGLHKITEQVIEELSLIVKRGGESQSDFVPWVEIPARFVLEFYGLTPTQTYDYEQDELKEWFRRKQEELHRP